MQEQNEEQTLVNKEIFYKNKCPYPILEKSLIEYDFNNEQMMDLMQIACSFQEKKSIQPEVVLFADKSKLESINEKALIKQEKEKYIQFIISSQKRRIPNQLLQVKFKRIKTNNNDFVQVMSDSFQSSNKKNLKLNKKQQEIQNLYEITKKQVKEQEQQQLQEKEKEIEKQSDQQSLINNDDDDFEEISNDNQAMGFEDDEYDKNQSASEIEF